MSTIVFRSWAAGLACALACSAAAAAKPNIVMIMTDDLDMSVWTAALTLGYFPQIQTHLIAKGTTFDNTFVALSTCCPSRSTYLTGQYPHNHGVIRNGGPRGGFNRFTKFTHDDNTLATWLKNAGYRTGLIGKYLNGYGKADPLYRPPGWDNWQALGLSAQFDYKLSDNGVIVSYGSKPADYQTDVLAGLADAFIRTDDPRPFFLTLTPTAPHYETVDGGEDDGRTLRPAPRHADTPPLVTIPPESAAGFNESNMRDKPRWMHKLPLADPKVMRAGYNSKIAAMRAVDDLVGRVVTALSDTHAVSNTLIIFTSDNGYQYGSHRRTAKTDLYEESIRLPMVARAPGQTTSRVSADWAMNTDWAATIVDYAGAMPGRTLDGRSLRPQVEGTAGATGRRSTLVELPSDGGPAPDQYPFLMIRSKDPALTLDASGRKVLVYAQTYDDLGATLIAEELYDLDIDPGQVTSLHKSRDQKRVDQKAALSARLMQLKSCTGDGCRVLEN
jgi:N-acetylglucosamine-6-sulfatase